MSQNQPRFAFNSYNWLFVLKHPQFLDLALLKNQTQGMPIHDEFGPEDDDDYEEEEEESETESDTCDEKHTSPSSCDDSFGTDDEYNDLTIK